MKKIFLKNFGGIYLNGREEGRSAFLALEKEIASLDSEQKLFIDCSEIAVLAPSWCDEFFGEAEEKHSGIMVVDDRIHEGFRKSFNVVAESRKISFLFGSFAEK